MSRSSPRGQAGTGAYHHGDLRRALIDAALAEITANGPTGLSLRSLARSVGVSHAAPAHHFGDKTGVFTAIATEGFELLNNAQLVAGEGLDPADTLVPRAFAYIGFAIEHPSHFEVMWRADLYDPTDETLAAAKSRVFDEFYGSVAGSMGDLPDPEFRGAVAAAWSIVHGFATLWLSGNLAPLVGDDPVAAAALGADGLLLVAEATARQLGAGGSAPQRSSPPGQER